MALISVSNAITFAGIVARSFIFFEMSVTDDSETLVFRMKFDMTVVIVLWDLNLQEITSSILMCTCSMAQMIRPLLSFDFHSSILLTRIRGFMR